MNPGSLHWECGVLATVPPGKSLLIFTIVNFISFPFISAPVFMISFLLVIWGELVLLFPVGQPFCLFAFLFLGDGLDPCISCTMY